MLGFTLGVTILEACDFLAAFLLLSLTLNVAVGPEWNDLEHLQNTRLNCLIFMEAQFLQSDRKKKKRSG